MSGNNPTINVGLTTDIDGFIHDIKRGLGNINDLGLSEKFEKEIKDIYGLLDGLSKAFNGAMSGGLNTSAFKKAQKEITDKVNELEQRTSALENGMSSLINTMSKADGGKFSKELAEILETMQQLTNTTTNTVAAVTALGGLAQRGIDIHVVDRDQLKGLEELNESLGVLINKFHDVDANELEFIEPKNVQDAARQIDNLSRSADDLQEKIEELESHDSLSIADQKELNDLKGQLVDIGNMIVEISEIFGKGMDFNKLMNIDLGGIKVSGIVEAFRSQLAEMEAAAREEAVRINNELAGIGHSTSSIKAKSDRLTVPIDVSTTPNSLYRKAEKIIEEVQSRVSDHPLKIEFALISGYKTKKNQELLEQISGQLKGMEDGELKNDLSSLIANINKRLSTEIDLHINSHVRDTEREVQDGLDAIQDAIKDAKFVIEPDVQIADAERNRLQQELNDVAKDMVLTISKIVIDPDDKSMPKTNVKGADKEDVKVSAKYNKQAANIKKALQEVLNESVTPFQESVASMSGIGERFAAEIQKIVDSISKVTDAVKASYLPGSEGSLENMFGTLQERISGISGKLSGEGGKERVAELKEILALYREYQQLGGSRSIAELGGESNIQKWLKRNRDITLESKEALEAYEAELKKTEREDFIKEDNNRVLNALLENITKIVDALESLYAFANGNSIKTEAIIDPDVINRITSSITELKTALTGIQGTLTDGSIFSGITKLSPEDAANIEYIASAFTELVKALPDEALGNSLAQIKSFINSFGKESGLDKIRATADAINELRAALNGEIRENSLIAALQRLAEQGDYLKDLAVVLKSTKRQISDAVEATGSESAGLSYDAAKNNYNANGSVINAKARDWASQYGQVIDLQTQTKDGIIQINSLVKTQEGIYQRVYATTTSGEDIRYEKTEQTTAAIAKQIRTYAQVQQAFERMMRTPDNTTGDIVFDKDADPELWETMIDLAQQYTDQIGNLIKVTRQVRQDRDGNLLESFKFEGEKGHITMGREGDLVASSQDIINADAIIKKYQELSKVRREYLQLQQKAVDGSINSRELNLLEQTRVKYEQLQNEVNELSRDIGNSNAAAQKQSEYFQEMANDYSKVLEKYSENMSAKIEKGEFARANQNTQYLPGFQEEITAAKEAVEELKIVIADNANRDTPWDDDELRKVNELQSRIEGVVGALSDKNNIAATTEQVSKLLSKVNKDIHDNSAMPKELMQRYKELQEQLKAVQYQGDNTNSTLSEISQIDLKRFQAQFASLNAELKESEHQGKNFIDTMKSFITSKNAQFFATYFSFQDWIRYAREAINIIVELDTALVDLRKTAKMSSTELNGFYYEANDVAKEMGVTTKAIIEQSAAWSRLGYNTAETATEMAKVSSQFASISPGMDTSTAQEGLVSIMKGFNVDVADAERKVLDNINTIGNNFATSNDQIVAGLERSSSAMSAANNSLEETIALFTAGQEIAQDAEKMGNALRTISMRIRGYDEETEELSEEYENLTGIIADLTKTADTPGGVSLFTDATKQTYKSTYEILRDISKIWDKLTDKNQAQLLEKLFGKTRANQGAAILSNFEAAENSMKAMTDAAGSADREMEIIKESLEYKINALKETWVGIMQDLVDRGTIGQIIDFLTAVSEGIGNITNALGGLAPMIGAVVGGVMSKKGYGRGKRPPLTNMPCATDLQGDTSVFAMAA